MNPNIRINQKSRQRDTLIQTMSRKLKAWMTSVRTMAAQMMATLKHPLKAPGTHDNLIIGVAYFFMAGMLLFLTLKVVPYDIPTYKAYYLWDKAKDSLLFLCLVLLCKPLRRFLAVVLLYSLIRLSWQILVTITGEDINDIRWINATWLTLLIYLIILSIKEMLNRKGK